MAFNPPHIIARAGVDYDDLKPKGFELFVNHFKNRTRGTPPMGDPHSFIIVVSIIYFSRTHVLVLQIRR